MLDAIPLRLVVGHATSRTGAASFKRNLVSDIAIFVLKRDVKLQLTNFKRNQSGLKSFQDAQRRSAAHPRRRLLITITRRPPVTGWTGVYRPAWHLTRRETDNDSLLIAGVGDVAPPARKSPCFRAKVSATSTAAAPRVRCKMSTNVDCRRCSVVILALSDMHRLRSSNGVHHSLRPPERNYLSRRRR